MECERVRDEFVERLTGALAPERSRAIDEHVADCADCRAETARLGEMWDELGTLRMPASTGAQRRVGRMVDARARVAHEASGPTNRPSPRWVAGAILGIAAALVIGVALGQRTRASAGPAATMAATAASAPERYILLLHGPARTASSTGGLVPVDTAGEQAIVAEYRAWAMRLRDAGALVMAEKLADERTVLTAASATSPSSDAADALGGYFLIQAADSAEAMRIARDCPHLKHGGTVEVRRIQPT